jgi:hypothetical protein
MNDLIHGTEHSSAYCVELTNGPQDTHCGACEQRMEQEKCSRCGRGTGRNICGTCADDLRDDDHEREYDR